LELPLDPLLHLNRTKEYPNRSIVMQNKNIIKELENLLSDDISFYWNARRKFGVF
jgi:hypothetical protein